jgi:hypothetical protein
MAKVKYDLSNVEDLPEREHAPVGTYRLKVVSCEAKPSSNGNSMLEVRFHVTHNASGKKVKEDYNDIWEYPILDHEHPFVQNKTKNFLEAFGLKLKGDIDTDKMVGKSVQAKLKSDTDQDGDYRPRVSKYMPVTVESDEPDEPDADEAGSGDDDAVDLDAMDRKALIAFAEEEEVELPKKKKLKKLSDEDLRDLIQTSMSEDEGDDGDDGADDGDKEPVDYDTWSTEDLKKELKERELPVSGAKKVLAQRLSKDDGDKPF